MRLKAVVGVGLLAAASSLASWPGRAAEGTATPAPWVLLSLDGGGAGLLDAAMARGDMPSLNALQHAGVRAQAVQPAFPAKTAVGHATIWTGAWPSAHGVVGNRTDLAGPAGPWATTSGYASTALRRIPVFAHAARQGRRVLVYQCPHSSPVERFAEGQPWGPLGRGRLDLLDPYRTPWGEDGAWRPGHGLVPADQAGPVPEGWRSEAPPRAWRWRWAGRSWLGLSQADPGSPRPGYDALWLRADATATQPPLGPFHVPVAPAKGEALARQDWVGPCALQDGSHVFFRLFAMDPGTGAPLLFHTAPSQPRTNRPELVASLLQQGLGFAPGMAGHAYHDGELGPTLAEGGSGLAEARYVEVLALATHLSVASLAHLMQEAKPEAVFAYFPLPDQAEHQWAGYMGPGPAEVPSLAQALLPHWRAAFRLADRVVAQLAPPRTGGGLVVTSDHGMAGVQWDLRVNEVLRRVGLVAVGPQGQVDVARSLVSMPPHLGPALRVHRRDRWVGGRVAPEAVPELLAQAKAALLALRVKGPQGPVPLVSRWVEAGSPAARAMGLGEGIEVAFDLQPGYGVDASLAQGALYGVRPPNGVGTHLHDPRRPDMMAILVAAGPGLPAGLRRASLRLVDVAPSWLAWAGLAPLPQADGRAWTPEAP